MKLWAVIRKDDESQQEGNRQRMVDGKHRRSFTVSEKLLSVSQRMREEAKINPRPIPKCHPAVAESLKVVKDRKDLKRIKFSM